MPSVDAQAVPSPAPLPQGIAPTFIPKPGARGASQREKVLQKHLAVPSSCAQGCWPACALPALPTSAADMGMGGLCLGEERERSCPFLYQGTF